MLSYSGLLLEGTFKCFIACCCHISCCFYLNKKFCCNSNRCLEGWWLTQYLMWQLKTEEISSSQTTSSDCPWANIQGTQIMYCLEILQWKQCELISPKQHAGPQFHKELLVTCVFTVTGLFKSLQDLSSFMVVDSWEIAVEVLHSQPFFYC